MTRARLSVTVITLEEEEHLRACLESVAWADEIIVVDAESQDKTVEVARAFTDRVHVRPWPGFAAQKNFALEQATGEFVLSLDADEVVTPELATELRVLLAGSATCDGWEVRRRNIFWGAWVRHGGLYPDWQLRLLRRGRGRFVAAAVHESLRVDGRVGRLEGALLHHSYRGVADFVARAHRYAALAADERVQAGRRVRAIELALAPLGRFLSMYVVKRGFLDGARGFLLAALYAYYVLIRTAMVWERARR
jgi:glycosyltransferase involved in cell wall biosynthesis